MKEQPCPMDVAIRRGHLEPARHRLRQYALGDQSAHGGELRRAQIEGDAELRLLLAARREHPTFRCQRSGRGREARPFESDPDAFRRRDCGDGACEPFSPQRVCEPARGVHVEIAGGDVRHQSLSTRLEPPVGRIDGDRPVQRIEAQSSEPAAGAGTPELDPIR